MSDRTHVALFAGVSFLSFGLAQALANEADLVSKSAIVQADQSAAGRPLFATTRAVSAERSNSGRVVIDFGFADIRNREENYRRPRSHGEPRMLVLPWEPGDVISPQDATQYPTEPVRPAFDPKYEKQMVEYRGNEGAGTVVVDTPNKFLYLVQDNGKAMRYGIGVGRPGFTWSGIKQISGKREWPDWTPPPEMLARRPDLPRHMEGGPQNPLGARAIYLGSSLYRIHGSNEPWTIGTNVSSGCIRMRNEDVIDLYGRVSVGARVVVI